MAYEAKNIIVGAAKIFVGAVGEPLVPPTTSVSYADTLDALTTDWTNIGYTSNGLELQFAPEFGEVQVDQVLDVAKMFKSGMTVTLNTTMAETTLENLAFALASSEAVDKAAAPGIRQKDTDIPGTPTDTWIGNTGTLDLSAGQLGDCPVEKALVAVGPGPGECSATSVSERIYTAFRVLSIESVTVSAKRDEASMFDVSFRLLPDSKGYYGQIVDRTYTPA